MEGTSLPIFFIKFSKVVNEKMLFKGNIDAQTHDGTRGTTDIETKWHKHVYKCMGFSYGIKHSRILYQFQALLSNNCKSSDHYFKHEKK